jgi:hypothetical protein
MWPCIRVLCIYVRKEHLVFCHKSLENLRHTHSHLVCKDDRAPGPLYTWNK